MANKGSVSILGCGWLGFDLAKQLIQAGYTVKGSSTNQEKLSKLNEEGISSFQIKVDESIEGKNLSNFFSSPILVITLPFKRHFKDPNTYKKQIEAILEYRSQIDYLLFTSSTSIYNKENQIAKESDPIHPQNTRQEILYDIEQLLSTNTEFKTTVIRFAGLYGKDRQIKNFPKNRPELRNSSEPVNLIHHEDAVSILKLVIEKKIWGDCFNAVSNHHPTKNDLYNYHSKTKEKAIDSSAKQYKLVSNEKLKKRLGYSFKYPSPLHR